MQNPTSIQQGINKAVEAIADELARTSIKVKDRVQIAQIATLSADSDATIGELIADAMDTVEDGESTQTSLRVVEGMQFATSQYAPFVFTDHGAVMLAASAQA